MGGVELVGEEEDACRNRRVALVPVWGREGGREALRMSTS